jgi:hypothetical protein
MYDVEANDAKDGKLLLANTDEFELVYVSKSVLVTKYPTKFISAVAFALATELALALKKDPKLAASMDDKRASVVGDAYATECWQSNLGVEPESPIIYARR